MFTPKKNSITPLPPPKSKIQQDLCLCRTLRPIFTFCALFGMFPIVPHHRHPHLCTYKLSKPLLLYSLTLIVLYLAQTTTSIDFLHLTRAQSLPLLLNDIADAIYSLYIVLVTALNIYRFPRWIATLNQFERITKEGVFCQSARRVAKRVQFAIIGVLCLGWVIQVAVLVALHLSNSYDTDFDFNFFLNKTLHFIAFIFYIIFMSLIATFIGLLACFEKLTISCLKYVPIHPMKGINETNNTRDFFGLFSYELCKEEHPCGGHLSKMPMAELVEYLRILHEEISLVIYDLNDCFNPQFLFHTVVELTVLIIEWYAVVVYMAFSFKAPKASTIHVINCMFVVMHTLGMFLFLKNAQQLKNMIQGLNNFLLEYSTRITTIEEHQQVRLFVEKLKQHRPLTASGVFTIDLGIAGPISANILTYVLVALQFEIPKEE